MKILLLDNSPHRIKLIMGEKNFELLTQMEGLSYKEKLENLEELSSYQLIIAHSTYNIDGVNQDSIKRYAKEKNIDLLLFSGNNTGFIPIFQNQWNIEDRLLYSDKLIPFLAKILNGDKIEFFRLIYGDNWQLPLFLRYRHLIWQRQYCQDNETRTYFNKSISEIEEVVNDFKNLSEEQKNQYVRKKIQNSLNQF